MLHAHDRTRKHDAHAISNLTPSKYSDQMTCTAMVVHVQIVNKVHAVIIVAILAVFK